MDSEFLQTVRYKLQKRLKRLYSADYQTFHWALVQIWGFFQENEIIKGILDELERGHQECEQEAELILERQMRVGESESENDAICYWVIKKCVASSNKQIEIKVGHILTNEPKHDDSIEAFRLAFVEPLFDYIDENIDDKRMVLLLLKKFKHCCEWFHRAEMFATYKEETGHGESNLSRSLYEYLHDQGMQFHIEPHSASGRTDFISIQTGKDRLIADVKLFNPERSQNTNYIIKAFRQVYEYTKDFNESFGYLVIFKTCEQELAIPTQHQESSIPFITFNNKTIFFVIVDIFVYSETASNRGKLKAYEITLEQLVQALE